MTQKRKDILKQLTTILLTALAAAMITFLQTLITEITTVKDLEEMIQTSSLIGAALRAAHIALLENITKIKV
jgi:hypothetical protein